jgi:serine/threonine protein kinase
MLDESFNAKLGDFGLARFIDHAVGMQTMTAVSGTPGYVDPECFITGAASAESDVFSFGVVVLEVACGRRPMSLLGGQKNAVFRLVEWVWDLYGRGAALAAADERLKGEYDAAEVERVVAVGLWCAHPDPRARPSIRVAMAALQSNHGPVPALPAKMPVATYAVPLASPEGGGLFSYNASSSGTSSSLTHSLFVSLVYYAESTVCWFVVREKYCWMAANSADKSKRTGRQSSSTTVTSQTSCSSDTPAATGFKDSSSLLKHQWC